MNPPKHSTAIEIGKLLSGIGSVTRWRMLMELAKGEPLPAHILASRSGVSANAASKHLLLLRENGLLHRGYGNLYRIPKEFIADDGRTLDYGAFTLRTDYPDAAQKPRARKV